VDKTVRGFFLFPIAFFPDFSNVLQKTGKSGFKVNAAIRVDFLRTQPKFKHCNLAAGGIMPLGNNIIMRRV